MRIDLHTHSTASDGTDTPAQLVTAAVSAGLDVVALTDHDTCAGWPQAAAAARAGGLTLVPGIEISCQRDGRSIHLLGYLVDPAHPALEAELERVRAARATRLKRSVEVLAAAGIPVTYAEVLAQVPPGATPGRPHIADALVASGVVAHRDEAFARWLHNDGPYYVRHYAPDPADAVRLVGQAGGVGVLAHPFVATSRRPAPRELVVELAHAGLAGLEAYHPDHDEPARRHALALAAELGLFVTGSSDYHGSGKTNRLGQQVTDPLVLAEIERRATGTALVRQPRQGRARTPNPPV
ncbi:MAG: PHP domain-containing protein [Dermatophilaceae bacterium]